MTLRGTSDAPGTGGGTNASDAQTGKRSGSGPGSDNGAGVSGAGGPRAAAPANPDAIIPRDGYTVTAPITLSDLVNFRPAPGVDHMEPNGWMVIGLETNFYATAAAQVQTGLLLGRTASVRFTPVRYHWSYGDGASRSSAVPGSTWKAQQESEFSPTTTSHVYRSTGTYTIDLGIDFTAEYHYTSPEWIPISGVITVPTNRLTATAGRAKTVLVNQECTANPTGPGC